jgi:putative transposase
MARRIRIQFPGAMYHIINRGNYRRDLFETTGAAMGFERAVGEARQAFAWHIHAFAIMRNHFHLALTTPFPNLVEGMHWLQTTFAARFNRFRSENGHLFQGRYQSPLIQDAAALTRVVDYIHLNPVSAGIVPAHSVANFRWTSLARFVKGPRPVWLSPASWLKQLQLDDSHSGWAGYVEHLLSIANNPLEQQNCDFDEISRGCHVGTLSWRRALAREHQHRALEQDLPHAEIAGLKEARWQTVLESALRFRGLTEAQCAGEQRSRWKIEIAHMLRKHAGAPYRWIANALLMGSPLSVRVAVCRLGKL